jgi:inorganic pyrophosphatase
MAEMWDALDENRVKIGKLIERGSDDMKNYYHLVVHGLVINSKGEILIIQRAPHRNSPYMWEYVGGSVLAGETSLEGVLRELKEEIGIEFNPREANLVRSERRGHFKDFYDCWLFKRDINIEDIKFTDNESIDAKWVNIPKIKELLDEGKFIKSLEYVIDEYEKCINLEPISTYKYIGSILNVEIDRPLGSKHPKWGYIYPINYGFIPNTVSGDGEEVDAFILGQDKPIKSFKGRCIAVIHRLNDNDDKLVIVPDGVIISNEEIRENTLFQEKYYLSEIIR